MAESKFNPDYGDDPEVLKGALVEASEAIGHLRDEIEQLQAKLEAKDKEIKKLKGIIKPLLEAYWNMAQQLQSDFQFMGDQLTQRAKQALESEVKK